MQCHNWALEGATVPFLRLPGNAMLTPEYRTPVRLRCLLSVGYPWCTEAHAGDKNETYFNFTNVIFHVF